MKIDVYTDGGCIDNGKRTDAPGGLGIAIYVNNKLKIVYSRQLFETPNTNQKSELRAAQAALKIITDKIVTEYCNDNFIGYTINLYSDSAYLINGITNWINGWKRNGWINSQKQPVANKEIWEEIDKYEEILNNLNVSIQWNKIKGHNGIEGNELVDSLVKDAMNGKEVYNVFNYNSEL